MTSISKPITFDDLENDILDLILTYLNDYPNLDSCRNVCKRWGSAVKRRMKKFEYVIGADELNKSEFPLNTLRLEVNQCLKRSCLRRMFLNLDSEYLPNVKFVDLFNIPTYSYVYGRSLNQQVAKIGPQLRGFVDTMNKDHPTESFCVYTRNLTIYQGIDLVPYICEPQVGRQLKQLSISFGKLSLFLDNTSSFRNLERLYFKATSGWVSDCKGKAELTNLKVLVFTEIQPISPAVARYLEKSVALDFLDLCPNLVEAKIRFPASVRGFVVNENIKNYNLKDLTIDYWTECIQPWDTIRKTLIKFPCLKRLAIRNNFEIVDENVAEIFELLPELDVLDLRNAVRLSWKVDYVVNECCRKRNRYIEFIGKRDFGDRYDVDVFNKKLYRSLVKGEIGDDHFFVPYLYDPYLLRTKEFDSLSRVAGAANGLQFHQEKGWIPVDENSKKKKEDEEYHSLKFCE